MVIWNIIWPTFAMVALVFVVWTTLFVQRARHMRAHPPTAADFADGEAALRYFRPVEMPGNNLANLFEMPVLFFALVPLLMLTRQAGMAQILLAWFFVIARAVHSYVHIGPKTVRRRARVYIVSVAMLAAMWIGFFIDIVRAALVYRDAVAILAR